MSDVQRWKQAQQAEASHETHDGTLLPYDVAVDRLADWSVSADSLSGECVLAVGGGTGLIHSLEEPRAQVSVDPLYLNKNIDLADSEAMNVSAGGEALPLKNDQFDTVVSYNSIDHTSDPQSVLEEVRRVLKPGGRFLLSVNAFKTPHIVRERLQLIDEPHPWHFSPDELRSRVQQAGFSVTQFSTSPRFPDRHPVSTLLQGEVRKFGAILLNITWCTITCKPTG